MDMNPRERGPRPYEVLIRDQFGMISRAQALGGELTRRMIDGRVATGRWEIAAPGIYRVVAHPPSFRQRAMTASLWAGPDGLVSHTAAAALWRLDGIVRPSQIDVVLPKSGARKSDLFVVHTSFDLIAADRSLVGLIATTSALRTVFDLAGVVDGATLELAIEDGLRRRLFSLGQLRWRAASRLGKGYAGSGVFQELLARHDLGATDSGWELRVAQVLTDAGLPHPERQVTVLTSIGERTVDLGYRGPPVVAFEYDSDAWHSGVLRRHRDAARRNALRVAGCVVIEVTPSLMRDPELLVHLARRALDRLAS